MNDFVSDYWVRPLQAAKPIKIGEQLSKRSETYNWMTTMFGTSYNPDELDYQDYDEMLRDPQIKTGVGFLTTALLSKRYYITPASESDEDKEVAEFIERELENMQIPMRRVRKDLYTAIPYGYSVGELVFQLREMDNKITITKIKAIPIDTLQDCFKYDKYGDVEEVVQTVDNEEIEIPSDKCLIFSFDEQFGNKYGQSILSQIYDNYFMKSHILKWFMLYLQKHEGPTLVGKAGNNTGADELLSQLDGVKEGRQNIVIDKEDEVVVVESGHRGESFKEAITYHDTVIFRRFMIGSLLFGQAEASGSYAQSQTHFDTLKLFLDGVHEEMAIVFQEKIKMWVDMNFAVEDYPKFNFEEFNDKDLLGLLERLTPLAEKYIVDPASSWYRQLLKNVMEMYGDIKVEDEDSEEEARPIEAPEDMSEIPSVENAPTITENISNAFPDNSPVGGGA